MAHPYLDRTGLERNLTTPEDTRISEPDRDMWDPPIPYFEEQPITSDPGTMYVFRLFCTSALHPLDYAKTLIQLGHEPIAPRPGRTMFGARRLMLPNIFQYAYHIGTVDGFYGCYRGLSPKLLGTILSSYFGEKLARGTGLLSAKKPRSDEEKTDFNSFVEKMRHDVVVHCAGVVIAHPFNVISVRMMAQFIGREGLYDGLWQSVKEVWRTEGIAGFFSGIIPRLLCEVGCIVITSSITYLITQYVVKNRAITANVNAVTHFTVSSMLYPYHVVSTCMMVNGSRLKAGNPPLMDNYCNWYDCYHRLKQSNGHKRGSAFFFRTVATVPTKLKGTSPSSIIPPYPELK